MARTESQLEIYKIILGRKTMRQIIIEKEHIEEAIDDNLTLYELGFEIKIS